MIPDRFAPGKLDPISGILEGLSGLDLGRAKIATYWSAPSQQAGSVGLVEAREILDFNVAPAAAGFLSSLAFGLLGLWLIKLVVAREKLRWFAAYCAIAGAAALAYFIIHPSA